MKPAVYIMSCKVCLHSVHWTGIPWQQFCVRYHKALNEPDQWFPDRTVPQILRGLLGICGKMYRKQSATFNINLNIGELTLSAPLKFIVLSLFLYMKLLIVDCIYFYILGWLVLSNIYRSEIFTLDFRPKSTNRENFGCFRMINDYLTRTRSSV